VCLKWATTVLNDALDEARIGIALGVSVPSPSWPSSFHPQQ
jgi:hypothetical protein